jgi:hypothetical protein
MKGSDRHTRGPRPDRRTEIYGLFKDVFGDSKFPLQQWYLEHAGDPGLRNRKTAIEIAWQQERYYGIQQVAGEKRIRPMEEEKATLMKVYREAGLDPDERFSALSEFIVHKVIEAQTGRSAGGRTP